jgi:uncharacterized membrane protein
MVMNMTRRTVAYPRSPTRKRLHRLAAPLLLIPVLMIIFALAAILLVAMVIFAAFFAAAVALTALLVRPRVRRSP